MRLHPAKDGLVPLPHERGMTKRDRGGNKLVDVVSPETGFCVGVRSPLTPDGMSVRLAKSVSGGKGIDTRYDPESELYYDLVRSSGTDPIGLVVRTVEMKDDSLPCTRVAIYRNGMPVPPEKVQDCTAPVRRALSTRKENDAAVKAVLRAMDYHGPITREIRKAALEMIQMEKELQSRKSEMSGLPRRKGNSRTGRAK